jgi:hypothetical protein
MLVSMLILFLYAALILWPGYTSGIAWSVGSPKGMWQDYRLWYYADFFPLNYSLIVALITAVLAWSLLPILGIVTLIQLVDAWPDRDKRDRWIGLCVAMLAIVVVPLTFIPAQQFVHWLAD